MTYYDRAAEAVRLRGEGKSLRQIGKLLNASKSTVARWLAAAPAPAEPHPLDPADPPPADARGMIGEVVSAAELVHSRALAEHDPAVAGRAVVDLASATAIGARAERIEVQPGVWMTTAEIRSEMAGIYERAAGLVAEYEAEHGPTRCESCGVLLQLPPLGNDLPEVTAPAPSPEDRSSPALERARQTFERASAAVDQALEDGHLRAAQRANRQRTEVARVIVREERRDRERRAEGSFFFSAADTDKQLDEIRARAATLAAVELCPICGPAHRMAAVVAASAAG